MWSDCVITATMAVNDCERDCHCDTVEDCYGTAGMISGSGASNDGMNDSHEKWGWRCVGELRLMTVTATLL